MLMAIHRTRIDRGLQAIRLFGAAAWRETARRGVIVNRRSGVEWFKLGELYPPTRLKRA